MITSFNMKVKHVLVVVGGVGFEGRALSLAERECGGC